MIWRALGYVDLVEVFFWAGRWAQTQRMHESAAYWYWQAALLVIVMGCLAGIGLRLMSRA